MSDQDEQDEAEAKPIAKQEPQHGSISGQNTTQYRVDRVLPRSEK